MDKARQSGSADEHYNRGNALQRAGNFAEAVASYDQALAVRPDWVEALINRGVTFYETETYVLNDEGSTTRLPLPAKSSISGFVGGKVIMTLEQDWSHGGRDFRTGDLVAWDLDGLLGRSTLNAMAAYRAARALPKEWAWT